MSARPSGARFITLEGVDGAGKSTHIPFIAERLRLRGVGVVATREPGGTKLGETLRDLLLNAPMSHDTETLLMFAARREHLERVIRPALARGEWVLCDRYTDATWAYQGGGHGVDAALIGALEKGVHDDCRPDVTILFDVPPGVSRGRLARAESHGRALDKFEREDVGFTERVRAAYLARARAEPGRFRVVDSSRAQDEVRDDLARIVEEL